METTYIEDYRESGTTLCFKKIWLEKKKMLLLICGAYLCFSILIGFTTGMVGATPGDLLFGYVIFAGFVGAFLCSAMFYDISKKTSRISNLMLPASPAQKFMPRLLIVTVGFLVLAVLGFFIYEFANTLIYFILYHKWAGLYNPLLAHTTEWNYDYSDFTVKSYFSWDYFSFVVAIFTAFLFNNSIFIFGSVAWPQFSFLKTVFLMAIIQIVLSVVAIIVSFFYVTNNHVVDVMISEDHLGASWILIGVLIVLACAITYGAFRVFRKKTLRQIL